MDVIKLKAHFDDPDDPTSLPPRRRFLMFMNEMDRALSYCSGDEGLPDFWKPLYPGYAALVRVRAYVNTFTE